MTSGWRLSKRRRECMGLAVLISVAIHSLSCRSDTSVDLGCGDDPLRVRIPEFDILVELDRACEGTIRVEWCDVGGRRPVAVRGDGLREYTVHPTAAGLPEPLTKVRLLQRPSGALDAEVHWQFRQGTRTSTVVRAQRVPHTESDAEWLCRSKTPR